MGYEIPGKTISLVAAATITRFQAVSVDVNGKLIPAIAAVAGQPCAVIGVAQLGDTADRTIPVMINGVSQVVYGGVVTAGDMLTTGAAGVYVKATAPVFDGTGLQTTRGTAICGTALQSGILNTVGTMLLK